MRQNFCVSAMLYLAATFPNQAASLYPCRMAIRIACRNRARRIRRDRRAPLKTLETWLRLTFMRRATRTKLPRSLASMR